MVLLLLSLVPTALRLVTGYRGALRVRRALGLYSFMYATLHFLAFAGLDYGFEFDLILQAMFEGRRIPVGAVSLALLIPLAVTSTTGWIKRLGKNWRRLHRLVYLAAGLAVLHYVWTFKELRVAPIVAGVVLLLLLVVRLPPIARALGRREREQS
jgi:sulfoxide reductase heme-binding subunit YedZ